MLRQKAIYIQKRTSISFCFSLVLSILLALCVSFKTEGEYVYASEHLPFCFKLFFHDLMFQSNEPDSHND